jgi:outer membrane protein assembly factor BamD
LRIFTTLFKSEVLVLSKLTKFFIGFFIVVLVAGCSSSVDTTGFTAEEYYNYAINLYNDEDYEPALAEFQNFLLQFPGSTFNDDAQYYLGMTYYKRKQYLLGAYEFSKLVRNIAASPFVPDAQFMLAESYYKLAPVYQLDQAYTKKAIEEYQAFIDFFPANPKVEDAEKKIAELNERLARKDYESAVIYEKMEYEKAAIKYFGNIADTYHDTKYGPLALYRKILLEDKKLMTGEALNDIAVFMARYPQDSDAKEMQEIETKLSAKK